MSEVANIDRRELALKVSTTMTAMYEQMTALTEITKAAYEADHAAYVADNYSRATDIKRDLSYATNDCVDSIQRYLKTYIERTDKAVEYFDRDMTRQAEREAIKANIAKADTMSPITTPFTLLAANVDLDSKGKPSQCATVLYMIEGTVFEARFYYSLASGKITHEESGSVPFSVVNRSKSEATGNKTITFIFKAEMTDEEIAKAAFVRKKIFDAAQTAFDKIKWPKKKAA